MIENVKIDTANRPEEVRLRRQERLLSYQRQSGKVESIARVGWWGLCRSTFTLLNRLDIRGKEYLPEKPPFVLVSNHSSHLDALILATMLPMKWRDQIFPLAAKDVFFDRPQVAGFATTFINAMPVWRSSARRHGLLELRDRLIDEESIYILFPEGTRTRTVNKMSPFKPGIGMLVASTSVPVVPCYLTGTFSALPPGSRMIRPGQIQVTMGRPLVFEDATDDRCGWEEISSRVEHAVRTLASVNLAIATDTGASAGASSLGSTSRRRTGSLETSPRFY